MANIRRIHTMGYIGIQKDSLDNLSPPPTTNLKKEKNNITRKLHINKYGMLGMIKLSTVQESKDDARMNQSFTSPGLRESVKKTRLFSGHVR